MINIDIDEIVEALEMVNENSTAYLNLDNGEIEWLSDFMEREEAEEISEKIESGNYARLPSQYEIHEYEMMEKFIETIPLPKIQNELAAAISGKGAFRRFKNTVRFYRMENEWYEFRNCAYRTLSENWLEELKEKQF